MLKKVAITGGIATGKSTLLSILKNLGFLCISCDEIVKHLYQKKEIQAKIIKLFGEGIYRESGTLNRELMLEKILRSPELKKALENLLHPEVLKEVLAFFRIAEEKKEKICFVEVPLLFEASWEKYFDEIWVITCSEKTQKERIKKLKGPELFMELSKLQLPLKEKVKRADRVFSSEKPKERLEEELKTLLKEYLKGNNQPQ
jgi:dephospho-CoA kinase